MLTRLPISLPPAEEQNEIVSRVEKLFSFADRLEARYNAARKQVDQLTPALLAKAFRGELVEQDPNDEPASVLLERIKAERASSAAPRSPRSARAPRKAKAPESPASSQASEQPQTPDADIPALILAAMQPGREYARAEITAAGGISDVEWSLAIKKLKEEGKVVQTGERRGARYRVIST